MKQRIWTAIAGLVVVFPILLIGSWPFILFTYVLATIALVELIKAYPKKSHLVVPTCLAILFLWFMLLPDKDGLILFADELSPKLIVLFVLLLLTYTVLSKNKFTFADAGFILIVVAYISFGFYFITVARIMGLNYLLFILFSIWATDSGAYFFGRALGKRKLWPAISPNKTVAGAIGGIILTVLTAVVFQFVHPFPINMMGIIAVAIIISIVGQMGDLVASACKRHYQIKDFGHILPGHGGILDRLDSLLFVLPFLYLIEFIAY
ncbi:phosphatidate cytidylyltransferase [Virgibacillus sp. W0181]|uniref:phosphatidate cytidylyltransferase n=1 Tax=Virgibacillus sp. W0181 TaxID=3391581 RepID=UPI003F4720EE